MTDESYLTPQELEGLKRTFHVQTREMLVDYGELVLELERSRDTTVPLRALERTVHTIKGDSMALGFERLSRLAHELEDLFRSLRGLARIDRENVDQLLTAGDVMSGLLDAYCEQAAALPEVESLCSRLQQRASDVTDDLTPRGHPYRLTIWFARDCRMHSAGALLVRRRLDKLATIVAITPDPDSRGFEEISRFSIDLQSDAKPTQIRGAARVPGVTSKVALKKLSSGSNHPAAGSESQHLETMEKLTPGQGGGGSSEQLRVEVSKVDRIMNLVGELVIARSMVAQAQADLETYQGHHASIGRLGDANTFLERTLRDLQAAVLNIRMVPVEHVFRRFPRLVRDLANAEGKQVELEVRGGLTELDKTIVDALGEPLLHLVRNAIDHGLETPSERERSGKPRCGRLVLQAFYEGNHVHIVVEDDGRGIDVAEVAEKATRLGLGERLGGMSESEILDTIYQPGFTTREIVSDVSGRGIGMDVVRESIENLKGVIELTTARGRGTRFLIRLPVTLAILRAILVGVDEAVFAVPLTGVLEIVRMHGGDATSVLGRGVLQWRGKVVTLVPLREALGLERSSVGGDLEAPRSAEEVKEHDGFVLLVGEAERRIGLVAEKLLGEQELVVKPIEDSLTRSPGVAGASILGDGRVVLILHVRGLLDKHVSPARRVEVLH